MASGDTKYKFTATDGGTDVNGHGAEVKVEMGIAPIESVERHDPTEEQRKRGFHGTLHVKFDHTYRGLTHPITGYMTREPGAALDALRAAVKDKTPIGYRIEVRRKPHVDRGIPIADVGNDDRTRVLVGVQLDPDGGGEWLYTNERLTNPLADPQFDALAAPIEQITNPGASGGGVVSVEDAVHRYETAAGLLGPDAADARRVLAAVAVMIAGTDALTGIMEVNLRLKQGAHAA